MESEADLLASAGRYSFRARMDGKEDPAGPVFVSGSGSEVEDVNGKRYLDFNSGQMCAALGHNHPTVTAAIKLACDTLIHAHSSYTTSRRSGSPSALRASCRQSWRRASFCNPGRTPTRRR